MNLSPQLIAAALCGDVSSRDSAQVPGPGHSRKDRSLSVTVSDHAPDGFLVHSFAGDDWQECRDYVKDALGIRSEVFRHVGTKPQPTKPRTPDQRALSLWNEAGELNGSLAAHYLSNRGLEFFDWVEGLRFHPSCPFGQDRHPCMIGLYRDIVTDEPRSIHRTALTANGEKTDRKALGPKGGCAIKLDDNADVTVKLTIGEGIETCLAAASMGFRPIWCVGDAGEIARFPVLPGVESLTIMVDNDASGTGQSAAQGCSTRWTDEGREVFRVIPQSRGFDMADLSRRAA